MGVYFRTFIARFTFDFVFCVPTVILQFMAFPVVINKFFSRFDINLNKLFVSLCNKKDTCHINFISCE